jgi:hypothetical protein
VTTTLTAHLKGKAECRDLFQELMNMHQIAHPGVQPARADVSRSPGV